MGGGRFMAMTGINQIVATDEGVRFHIPNAKDRIKAVEIVLNPRDLYEMRWLKISNRVSVQIAEDLDVYASQLVGFFEKRTGLATRL
jgi:hypothetical protein